MFSVAKASDCDHCDCEDDDGNEGNVHQCGRRGRRGVVPAGCCPGLSCGAALASSAKLASSLSCFQEYQKKARLAAEEEMEAAKIIDRVEEASIKKSKNDSYSYRLQTHSVVSNRSGDSRP